MTTNPNNSDPGQVPQNQDPPGQAPTSTPQAGNESQPQLSHEDALRLLAETRREAAENRVELNKLKVAQKKQEEAAAAAEQARLAEQGQFKELAAKHEKRVQELEPVAQSYGKLAEQIQAQIEAEIKDWPIEVKNLVPPQETVLSNGERRVTPVEERLEHMTRLRPLLEKLQLQAKGQQQGNRPNPTPASPAATQQERMQANRDSFIRQRSYGL